MAWVFIQCTYISTRRTSKSLKRKRKKVLGKGPGKMRFTFGHCLKKGFGRAGATVNPLNYHLATPLATGKLKRTWRSPTLEIFFLTLEHQRTSENILRTSESPSQLVQLSLKKISTLQNVVLGWMSGFMKTLFLVKKKLNCRRSPPLPLNGKLFDFFLPFLGIRSLR